MTFAPVYLDASALLKLVLPERETETLRSALAPWPDWVSSRLSAIECRRAVRRAGGPAALSLRMDHVLSACTLIHFDESTLRLAERIGPPEIRSLDAIHLAAALSLGDYPAAFITYDQRLAAAARALDLNVVIPGA